MMNQGELDREKMQEEFERRVCSTKGSIEEELGRGIKCVHLLGIRVGSCWTV